MPRGKFTNHKGRHRRFTNPEELEEERKREERKKEWRQNRGELSTDSEDEEGESSKSKPPPRSSDESDSEEEEDDSDDAEKKGKGVEKLIEISNPNRVQKKDKKVSNISLEGNTGDPELSRREREELQRQAEAARYQKLHAEGKTRQAQADLARLAIIKQQREEAAKKREAEKQMKEAEAKERVAARSKALGKKS